MLALLEFRIRLRFNSVMAILAIILTFSGVIFMRLSHFGTHLQEMYDALFRLSKIGKTVWRIYTIIVVVVVVGFVFNKVKSCNIALVVFRGQSTGRDPFVHFNHFSQVKAHLEFSFF